MQRPLVLQFYTYAEVVSIIDVLDTYIYIYIAPVGLEYSTDCMC